jgi:poly(A) polymerase
VLKANGLAHGIFPLLDLLVERADDPFVRVALQDTDRRVAEGKPVAPSFLLACLLWQDVREAWQRGLADGRPTFEALATAVDTVFDARIGDVSGRGKLGADMREIWMMQPRFDKRSGRSPFSLVEQPRFRAGFDFLRLRAQVGEVPEELSHWWETFSQAGDPVRRDMIDAVRLEQQGQRAARKPRRRRRRGGASEGGEATPPASDA